MRRHWPFIVILLLAATVRFAILFQSQTHVHSDEAIIGLMGKHIVEGRYFPFYMYGQPYNAGGAWEAYLAAVPFAVFGVGVLPLKGTMVVLSLVCLVLFYRMALSWYDRPTATLAALFFALAPSLLKWHFQVRGYSFYFLSIPVLTGLFFAIASSSPPRARQLFQFGLACGLSVWNLELVLSLVGIFWVLLAWRRKLSVRNAVLGAAGFAVGYAPAILFNLTHQFSNWRMVFAGKTSSGGVSRPSTFTDIFIGELPKFFGTDTVLWYYAETSATGYVFYAIAVAAAAGAIVPFVKRPSRIRDALRGDLAGKDENKDFLLLLLTLACFVPYLVAPIRVPGYFLGGCFFLSILAARLVVRCGLETPRRIVGIAVLAGAVLAGIVAMVEVGRRNEIETLTLDQDKNLYLNRFPGADLDAVQRHLRERHVTAVWTTLSFAYPLAFETRETLAVSESIFGWNHNVYPESVPRREPPADGRQVFVVETDSPLRPVAEQKCAAAGGAAPLVTEHGTLTVIEEKPRP